MVLEKTYEERINGYSLEELHGVKKRIDAVVHPDRYELILKEIEKRKNGFGPKQVAQRDDESILNEIPRNPSGKRKVKDIPSFLFSFAVTTIYKEEIEQVYGSTIQISSYILLIFGIYFSRKAWGK